MSRQKIVSALNVAGRTTMNDLKRILEHAACRDMRPAVFFEDQWFKERRPYTEALAKARTHCDGCPVRWECLDMEMSAEHKMAEHHRAGVFGGLTAQQRHALERRGASLHCQCGEAYDPVQLRTGDLSCQFCGRTGYMAPIPDRGDGWTQRHTALAQDIIAWLVENVEPEAEAPTAAKLARTLSVRVNDLRRVFESLLADHILVRADTGALIRKASASSAKAWLPPHLRFTFQSSTVMQND